MKKKIYLAEDIHPDARKKLDEYGELVDNLDNIEELDAIFLRAHHLNREQISRAKKCKVIARHGVGMDILDLDACKEFGIPIVFTPMANSYSVAEFAFTMAMCLMRNVYQTEYIMKTKGFDVLGPVWLRGNEMKGCTVGLVGVGRIGGILATLYRGVFDCNVIAFDPKKSAEELAQLGVKKMDTLEEMVGVSQIVSICCPLKEDTKGMFNKALFEKFNPQAILINTARGAIVNEEDLYEALITGKVRAMGTDVYVDEYKAFESPLNQLDNFIGFPHCAANTHQAMYNMAMIAADGLIDVLEGREPKHLYRY